MSRLTAVIAVASGSSDVDVIVTASHLRRLGMEVIIASAEGEQALLVLFVIGLVYYSLEPSVYHRLVRSYTTRWPRDKT